MNNESYHWLLAGVSEVLLNKATLAGEARRLPTRENIVAEMEKELRENNQKKKSSDYVKSGWFDIVIQEEGFPQYIERWKQVDFTALMMEYVSYHVGSVVTHDLVKFLIENIGEVP